MEPSIKLFYHGSLLKTIGGCNFEKFRNEINRSFEYISQEYNPGGNFNKEYEMPYYYWESQLKLLGNSEEFEQTGSMLYIGFRGPHMFRTVPEERGLNHEIMKK